MIVRRIELKNFASYREAAVEFPRDAAAIAIVGPNGAGKSSILDAIYYALYGESLRGKIGETVRLGATSMQVNLYFEAGGREYLVTRKTSLTASGRTQSEAHLYVFSQGKRKLLARGAKSVTEEVTRVLGVDKALFTSAYYVRQGEIAALLSMEPSERKRLVARLLGLEYFEVAYQKLLQVRTKYEERVVDGLRREVEEKRRVEAALAEVREKISVEERRLRELRARLENVLLAVKNLSEKLEEVQRRLRELREADKKLGALREKIGEYKRRLLELEEENKRLEALRKELEDMLREYSSLKPYIDSREAARQVLEGEEKLRQITDNIREIREKLALIRRLEPRAKRYLELKKVVESLGEREKELSSLRERLKLLEERRRHLEEKAAGLEEVLGGYFDLLGVDSSVDASTLQELLLRLQEETRRLLDDARKRLDRAKAEAEKLQARKLQLEKWLRSLDELREPRCPLCGSPLTDEHRMELRNQFLSELEDIAGRLKTLAGEISRLEEEVRKREEEYRRAYSLDPRRGAEALRALAKLRADKQVLEEEAGRLREKLEEIAAELGSLQEVRQELDSLEADYHHYTYLKENEEEAVKELEALEEQAKRLSSAVDSARLVLRRAGLEKVDPREIEEKAEHGARLKLKIEERRRFIREMEGLPERIASTRENIRKLEEEAAALEVLVKELPVYERREAELRSGLKEARERKGKLEGEIKGLEERLRELYEEKKRLEEELRKLAGKEESLAAAEKVLHDINVIRGAFHRDGAPRLIREKAVPRIERLTREFLELFDLDIGEVKVTDDFSLLVGSGGKMRGISTLSGGEQAVAALSFRLAIARSTVEGRGLLMFDEPTANLDEERRHMLVEALKRLFGSGDSPRQMILVTHDRELEDAADVVYEVKRTPQGSRVELAS